MQQDLRAYIDEQVAGSSLLFAEKVPGTGILRALTSSVAQTGLTLIANGLKGLRNAVQQRVKAAGDAYAARKLLAQLRGIPIQTWLGPQLCQVLNDRFSSPTAQTRAWPLFEGASWRELVHAISLAQFNGLQPGELIEARVMEMAGGRLNYYVIADTPEHFLKIYSVRLGLLSRQEFMQAQAAVGFEIDTAAGNRGSVNYSALVVSPELRERGAGLGQEINIHVREVLENNIPGAKITARCIHPVSAWVFSREFDADVNWKHADMPGADKLHQAWKALGLLSAGMSQPAAQEQLLEILKAAKTQDQVASQPDVQYLMTRVRQLAERLANDSAQGREWARAQGFEKDWTAWEVQGITQDARKLSAQIYVALFGALFLEGRVPVRNEAYVAQAEPLNLLPVPVSYPGAPFADDLVQAYRFLNRTVYLPNSLWKINQDLPLSGKLAEEILRHPIHKVMVVGGGLLSVCLLLAMTGREVTFVDREQGIIEMVNRDLINRCNAALRAAGKPEIAVRVVQSEIGTLDIAGEGLQPGTYDLVTLVDLRGGIIKGDPDQWYAKVQSLLKPRAFVLAAEGKGRQSPVPEFSRAFPNHQVLAGGQIPGKGIFEGTFGDVNRLYQVENPESPANATANISPGTFGALLGKYLGGRRQISFADLGAGPRAEFGRNLRLRLKGMGIEVNQGISIENTIIDRSAPPELRVTYADTHYPDTMEAAGLFPGSMDLVTINNIVSLVADMLAPGLQLLGDQGFLMVTFREV